jgi:hypothetical protein
MLKISQYLLEEDQADIERLTNVLRSMKQDFLVAGSNVPMNGTLETENVILQPALLGDTKRILEHLQLWHQAINDTVDRYGTERNIWANEELLAARQRAETWVELVRKTLYRCEHSVNGTEYHDRLSDLRELSTGVSSWLGNLEQRSSGENGVIKSLYNLQAQVDFRLNSMLARGDDRPLNRAELTALHDSLDKWKKELTAVIATQSTGCDRDLVKINDRIDEFVRRIVEQMQADTGTRTEGLYFKKLSRFDNMKSFFLFRLSRKS